MQTLESHITTNSATFKVNRDRMRQLSAELRSRRSRRAKVAVRSMWSGSASREKCPYASG